MNTSVQELKMWHQRGIDNFHNYMIIVCDTFSHDDYPVYVNGDADAARAKKTEYDGKNMQRVIEVYDLDKPFEECEEREMAV